MACRGSKSLFLWHGEHEFLEIERAPDALIWVEWWKLIAQKSLLTGPGTFCSSCFKKAQISEGRFYGCRRMVLHCYGFKFPQTASSKKSSLVVPTPFSIEELRGLWRTPVTQNVSFDYQCNSVKTIYELYRCCTRPNFST